MNYRAHKLFFVLLILFTGCTRVGPLNQSPPASGGEPAPSVQGSALERCALEPVPGPSIDPYINQAIRQTVDKITTHGMGEYEKAKAAFDYLIETAYFEKPVGLDIWRIRGGGEIAPPYVENKCLSILLFGLGECEDYAAALPMLLRGMGMNAEYVPGLTYSAEGALVDHAWTIAEINGTWYHLDSQLQDNISRNQLINYRYFMKGDRSMSSSHRWGQNLIDSGLLSPEQNQEIAESFLVPDCPRDFPAPDRKNYTPAPHTDSRKISAKINQERREFEALHGPLAPLELNLTPPVFRWAGYGPPD